MNEYMPWIVALIIGLLSSGSAFLQFKNSKKLLEKQLSNAREIAQLDFNKSVLSKNRQEWINTLRNELSIFLSVIESLSVIIKERTDHGVSTYETNFPELVKLRETLFKVELLLNPSEELSIELLGYMEEIKMALQKDRNIKDPEFVISYIDVKTKLLYTAKIILKTEWDRVKEGK